jgi:hypothetical protein
MSSSQEIFKTPSPHRLSTFPSLRNILRESDFNDRFAQLELENVFTESEDAVLLDAFAQAPMIARSVALAPWKPESLPFGMANRLANLAVAQQKARGVMWRHPLKTTRRRLVWLARHQRLSTHGAVLFGPPTAERGLPSPSKQCPRILRANSNPFIEPTLRKTKVSPSSMMKRPMSPKPSRLGARSVSLPSKKTKYSGAEDNFTPISRQPDGVSAGFRTPTIVARTLFQDSVAGNELVRTDSDDSIIVMRKCNDVAADSLFGSGTDENYESDSQFSDMVTDLTEDTPLTNRTASSYANSVASPTTPISPLVQKSGAVQLLHFNKLSLGNHHALTNSTQSKNGGTDITGVNVTNQKMLRAGSLTNYMDEGLDEVAYIHDDQVIGDEYY